VPEDRDLAAGDLARFDVAGPQVLIDAVEPLSVQSGGFGVDFHVFPPRVSASAI
jgi:hypothetical protein